MFNNNLPLDGCLLRLFLCHLQLSVWPLCVHVLYFIYMHKCVFVFFICVCVCLFDVHVYVYVCVLVLFFFYVYVCACFDNS